MSPRTRFRTATTSCFSMMPSPWPGRMPTGSGPQQARPRKAPTSNSRFSGRGYRGHLLLAKICRECSKVRFEVAVPRRASLGDPHLLRCGANPHGKSKRTRPYRSSIPGCTRVALKNSVEHLAELTKRYPEATDLFASSRARHFASVAWLLQRVAESAAQYAERL